MGGTRMIWYTDIGRTPWATEGMIFVNTQPSALQGERDKATALSRRVVKTQDQNDKNAWLCFRNEQGGSAKIAQNLEKQRLHPSPYMRILPLSGSRRNCCKILATAEYLS